MTEIINIIPPSISGGSKNLRVASYNNHIVNTQMNITLTKVPKTSDLWYPYDKTLVAVFWETISDTIEIANPTISDNRCAQSVNIAIDPDKTPPIV